jgi:hypothetical protein
VTKLTLPRLNQTGANEWSDVESNDIAIREIINGEISNENIAAGANIARSKLEASAQGTAGVWYTPKVIPGEETTTSLSPALLATPDEIPGVVMPTNGLIAVGYHANFKSSAGEVGVQTSFAGLFLGANQVKQAGVAEKAQAPRENTFARLYSGGTGVSSGGAGVSAISTTGETFGSPAPATGVCYIYAAAGTYAVSVKFWNSAGTCSVKERALWVWTYGF